MSLSDSHFLEAPGFDDSVGEPDDHRDSTDHLDSAGVPRRFGSYEIDSELGRGGMGVVFRARQTELGRTVALKMILAGHLASARAHRRFSQEAVAAARIRHPHVVQVFEAGQVQGQRYFAMEYVDGPDLGVLARRPMEAARAARYVAQVARAVGCLHEHGILHRDLKPSNVLIDAEDQPRLTDFGLAKLFDDTERQTYTEAVIGSPGYMSPEQARQDVRNVGPWSDIYGLGAILFRLLTGRPPFVGESATEAIIEAMDGDPPRPRELDAAIPQQLEAICLKCLEKNPRHRYATAEELAEDLERFAAGEPVEASRLSVRERMRRWLYREPVLSVHLLLLTFVALIQGGWYLLFPTRAGPEDLVLALVLIVWAGCCLLLQQILQLGARPRRLRYIWAVLDTVFVSALLLAINGVSSPLLVAYPLLIVGSGLWLRVRPVLLVTALSVVGYVLLVIDAWLWHPERRIPPDNYVVVVMVLVATGALVSFHVRRARALGAHRDRSRAGTAGLVSQER